MQGNCIKCVLTGHESRVITGTPLTELLLQITKVLDFLLLFVLAHWLVLLRLDWLLWARRTRLRWWNDLRAVALDEVVEAGESLIAELVDVELWVGLQVELWVILLEICDRLVHCVTFELSNAGRDLLLLRLADALNLIRLICLQLRTLLLGLSLLGWRLGLLLLLLALLPWFPFLFLPTGGSPSSSDAASTSMAVESSVVSVVPSVRSKVGPLIASLLRQGNWWFLLTAKPAVWRPSM